MEGYHFHTHPFACQFHEVKKLPAENNVYISQVFQTHFTAKILNMILSY